MKIADEKVVSVQYRLTASKDKGPEQMIEETSKEHPFVFLAGFGGVLEDFEGQLMGLTRGDHFDIQIVSDNAYGPLMPDYVIDIDRGAFEVDGKFDDSRVKVDAELEMRDQEGNPLMGIVKEITDTYVKMDFNHPLAGFDLHFMGEVLDVRDASQEELDHGHVHGPHGHHH